MNHKKFYLINDCMIIRLFDNTGWQIIKNFLFNELLLIRPIIDRTN